MGRAIAQTFTRTVILRCAASLGLTGAGLLMGLSRFVASRGDVALELSADCRGVTLEFCCNAPKADILPFEGVDLVPFVLG
jgi:hypothetical protein